MGFTQQIHMETWEEAMHEVRRRKQDPDGAMFIYKIVESAYEGFDVLVIDPDTYVEYLIDQAMIHPQMRKMGASGFTE